MQIQDKYFRAYYDKEGNTGELYLYGYIGQKADPFYGEDPEEDITDKAVVKAMVLNWRRRYWRSCKAGGGKRR